MEWMSKEEYAKMTGLGAQAVDDLIERKKVRIKMENGTVMIDPSSGTGEVVQELYDEDRKTIEALQQQLKLALDEVEFMKRKYKLMWNKTIEEHTS